MGCCCDDNETHSEGDTKYGTERQFDKSFKGPINKRSCTDVICCIIFVTFLIGQGVVAFFAFSFGDPKVLLYPRNSEGEFCGFGKHEDKPNLLFFDLVRCAQSGPMTMIKGCPTPQICVTECPTENWAWLKLQVEDEIESDRNKRLALRNKYLRCIEGVNVNDTSIPIKDFITQNLCAPWYLNSSALVNRCLPAFVSNLADVLKNMDMNLTNSFNQTVSAANVTWAQKILQQFIMAAQYGQFVIEDIVRAWYMILIGIFVGSILSFIWCLLMRVVSCFIVYLTLLSFLFVFVAGCGISFYYYFFKATKSVEYKDFEFTTDVKSYLEIKQTWLIIGIIAGILALIVLLIILFLRKRIALAVAIIGQASKAVAAIMTTLIFPIFPFIFELGTVGFSTAVGVYLVATGRSQVDNSTFGNNCTINSPKDLTEMSKEGLGCTISTYGGENWAYYLQFYNLFMFFWTLCFVVGFGQIVLAGTFASWYWSWEKPKDVPAFPIASSVSRVLRYHIGTVAFGSLIIAIVMMIRAMLTYIESKLKGKENKVAKFIICMLKCCFWCLEKCLKFLTKNAYIVTAIYGLNFCRAAKDAFFLILRNCVRLVVLDNVTGFVLLIGKLLMTGATGCLAYLFFGGVVSLPGIKQPMLNYFIVPVIIIVIGTFVVASLFFNVYDFAVDTLFICVMEDLERNDGTPEKPYFMSKDLMKVLEVKNKFKDDPDDREGACACCTMCCC